MKRLLFLTGLLLLTACHRTPEIPTSMHDESSSSVHVDTIPPDPEIVYTPGTKFVYDDKKTKMIYKQLRDCLDTGTPAGATLDALRSNVQHCDETYRHAIKVKDNPPTFYALKPQGKGPDPFERFVLCEYQLASSVNSLPSDESAATFRFAMRDCLSTFPNHL